MTLSFYFFASFVSESTVSGSLYKIFSQSGIVRPSQYFLWLPQHIIAKSLEVSKLKEV